MKKSVVLNLFFLFIISYGFSQETENKQEPAETSTEAKADKKENKEGDVEYWIDQLRAAMSDDEEPSKEDKEETEIATSEGDKKSPSEGVNNEQVLKRLDRIESLIEETLRKATEAVQRAGNAEALAKANWKRLNQLTKSQGDQQPTEGDVQKAETEYTEADSLPSAEPQEQAGEGTAERQTNDDPAWENEESDDERTHFKEERENIRKEVMALGDHQEADDTAEESPEASDEDGDEFTPTGVEGQKLEAAIQLIKETGGGWVQALQNGSSDAAVDEAETGFHRAAGEALQTYREASTSDEDIDLLKALNEMHEAINETQSKVNEMKQEN